VYVLSLSDQESWIRDESCTSPLQTVFRRPAGALDRVRGRKIRQPCLQHCFSVVRHEVHANQGPRDGWRHHSSASIAPFGLHPTCVTCPFSEQPMMRSFHCRHHRAKAAMHCARSTHGMAELDAHLTVCRGVAVREERTPVQCSSLLALALACMPSHAWSGHAYMHARTHGSSSCTCAQQRD
jgi:hypothetical protein